MGNEGFEGAGRTAALGEAAGQPLSRPLRRTSPWAWLGIAALAVLAVGVGAGWWLLRSGAPAFELQTVAFEAELPRVDLPESKRAEKVGEVAARVLLSPRYALVDGDPFPIVTIPAESVTALASVGLPPKVKRSGPNDLLIVPLFHELAWLRSQPREAGAPPSAWLLLADRHTPYRAFVELLYTAGQAGYNETWIAVGSPDQGRRFVVPLLPDAGQRPEALARKALALRASITSGGVSLKTRAGNLATGCRNIGPGITVPKTADSHHFGEIARCARELKRQNERFAAETTVTVTASPEVDLQTVLGVADALFQDDEGTLFPDAQFGVTR